MSALDELISANGTPSAPSAPSVGGGSKLDQLVSQTYRGAPAAPAPAAPAPLPPKPSFLQRSQAAFSGAVKKASDSIAALVAPPPKESLGSNPTVNTLKILPSEIARNLPLGVGATLSEIQDNPELAAQIGPKQLLQAVPGALKTTAQGYVKAPLSPFLTAYGATKQATGGTGEVRFNVPGLGEVNNLQARIADDFKYKPTPDTSTILGKLEYGANVANYTGEELLNGLFAYSLLKAPFTPREQVVAKGQSLGGLKVKQGPRTGRLYEAPRTTAAVAPEVVQKLATENNVPLKNFDPQLPTYFRIKGTSKGVVTGEIVQVKPSYFATFVKQFGRDINKVPPNQLVVVGETTKALDTIKPPAVETGVSVPPVQPNVPQVTPNTPAVTPPGPIPTKVAITPTGESVPIETPAPVSPTPSIVPAEAPPISPTPVQPNVNIPSPRVNTIGQVKIDKTGGAFETGESFSPVHSVPIEDVTAKHRIAQFEMNTKTVKKYESILSKGEPIDPIIIDEKGRIKDGYHRLAAMQELGVKNIPVVFVQESLAKAQAYWNKNHPGKPFPIADYQKETESLKYPLYAPPTQKAQVAATIKEAPKSIKQIAEETKIKEPNVRRILGVGTKEGTFERVDKGVYKLTVDGQDIAYVEVGDALEALPRLASEGFKSDMVFLDIPYDLAGNKGGNRMNIAKGTLYEVITPEQFAQVMDSTSKILRDENSPLVFMISQSKSSALKSEEYKKKILDAGFKPVAKGDYYKMSAKGTRLTMPMRSTPLPPEGIIIFNKSGKVDVGQFKNLEFKLVRPRGYQTEKPAELLNSLISMTTKEGDVILDPFAGSGVTGAEAVKLGRKPYLIEKNAEVVEKITKPRIEAAVKPVKPSLPEKPQRAPSGYASSGASNIDEFEKRIGEPVKEAAPETLKLYKKVEELIKKYAVRVGEGYLHRGTVGLYHPQTENIRLVGMNALSVAAHEITHHLDFVNKISEQLRKVTGVSKNGNPLYEKATAPLRKELSQLYINHYPGGKSDHPLKKRMIEGYATLLQKYVEAPVTTTQNYPALVKEMLKPGGKFYKPVIGEIVSDLQSIVKDYQSLNPLDKVGARVTSDLNPTGKKSFLTGEEMVRTEIADEVYPIEKLANEAGVGMTAHDPSLWIRQYSSSSSLFANNVKGDRGYWTFKDDHFVKVHDFNWGTLQKDLEKRQEYDLFNHYLVARDQYFNYQEMHKLKAEIDQAHKDELPPDPATVSAYKDLKQQLSTNGFSEDVVKAAYEENKDRFADPEAKYDALVRADLDFLHSNSVGLISDEEYKNLTSKEGYASMKRQFYDEVIGDESPQGRGISGSRPSSLKGRTGSSRTIVAPVMNSIKNHAEIIRKGLKQVVDNKLVALARKGKHPELFQEQQLQAVPDPETGRMTYPQDRDKNIIMGRINGKRVPILTDGYIKKTLDEILDFRSVGYFEKLLQGASRFFTKGTTGLFPGFTVTNFTIDQVTAVSQTTQNYVPIYSPLKEMYKVVLDNNSPEYKYFQEYMVLGGERQTMVGWQDLSAKELAQKIAHERTGILKAVDAINAGADIFAAPQKYSEIITRAVEYTKSRQAGDPQVVAIEKAGRVTAPFHHIGRLGGTKFGKTYIKSIPFFNPALQVLEQAYRSGYKSGPKAARRFFTVVLAVTAAQLAAFSILNAGGTKKQKDLYKDLDTNELSKYLWLPNPNGQTLIRLRIPDILNAPGTVINMVMADQIMNAQYTAGDYIAAGTSFLPTQANILRPGEMLWSWVTQLVKPGLQVASNVKDFPSVRPLESDSQLRKEPGQRFTAATPPVTKYLGEKFNISPIKLDYLLTGYAGRITGFATGKQGIYNPLSTLDRQYYFTSGRRVQQYYNMKNANDQQYNTVLHSPKDLTALEKTAIIKERTTLNSIGDLLTSYGNVDEKQDPVRAEALRNKILTQMDKL